MKKGDHLVSPRIGYEHHGLFIGNGKVIHYAGFSETFNKGSIEITTLEDFEQGNGSTSRIHILSVYDADERVERAHSRLGEDSYSIIFNNCEHFVTWCFNGFGSSSQVNNVAATTTALAHGYATRQSIQAATSVVAQQMASSATNKTVGTVIASKVTQTAFSTSTSVAIGLTTATTVTGATTAGLVSALAVGSIASAAAPIAVAVGVGYGAKKVFDWIFD